MRERITTWLDLVGLVLLVLAAATFVGRWSFPGALATGGALMLAASALIVARAPRRRREDTTA